MNIKTNNFVRLFSVGMFVLLTTHVYAQPMGGDSAANQEMRARGRKHFEEIYTQLGVTPQQQEQLKVQKEQHRQEIKELRANMQAKRQELRQALQEPELNLPRIQQIHEQLKALLMQQEDQRLAGILEIRKILTHEQFLKFHEKMQSMREKGRESFKGEHKRRWLK